MPESAEGKCQQCGATLLPKWRFCVACSAPVAGMARQPQGKLAESLRHLPSTHRPDKTLVFVPEHREARLKRARRNRRTVIVVVIGCVLLAVVSFAFWRTKERKQAQAPQQQRESMARRELDIYAKSLENFHTDVGRYPTLQEGLAALIKPPGKLDSWRGPYLDGDYSVDPWGREYVYQAFNNGVDYVLFTYGPEGESAGRYFLQVNSGKATPEASPSSR